MLVAVLILCCVVDIGLKGLITFFFFFFGFHFLAKRVLGRKMGLIALFHWSVKTLESSGEKNKHSWDFLTMTMRIT